MFYWFWTWFDRFNCILVIHVTVDFVWVKYEILIQFGIMWYYLQVKYEILIQFGIMWYYLRVKYEILIQFGIMWYYLLLTWDIFCGIKMFESKYILASLALISYNIFYWILVQFYLLPSILMRLIRLNVMNFVGWIWKTIFFSLALEFNSRVLWIKHVSALSHLMWFFIFIFLN